MKKSELKVNKYVLLIGCISCIYVGYITSEAKNKVSDFGKRSKSNVAIQQTIKTYDELIIKILNDDLSEDDRKKLINISKNDKIHYTYDSSFETQREYLFSLIDRLEQITKD